MNNEKILYAITVEDVQNTSEELDIPFEETDLDFIEEKIGEYFGSQWSDAVEFALEELQKSK